MRFLTAVSVAVVVAAAAMMLVPEFQVEVQAQPPQNCPSRNDPACEQPFPDLPPIDVKATLCKTLQDAEFEASVVAAAMCIWGPNQGCQWATATWIAARTALYASGC